MEWEDTLSALDTKDRTIIQDVVGTFPYYAHAIDCTMLAALRSIATHQANPTKNTMEKTKQPLDYAATHPNTIIIYQAIKMVLATYSNASYLYKSNVQSQAEGHCFMSNNHPYPPTMKTYLPSPKL